MSDVEEECPKYLLPASMCAHCRDKKRIDAMLTDPPRYDEKIPDSDVISRFPARFDKKGGCEYCGGDTIEGEPLCLTEDYGYVHAKHCEPPNAEELTFHHR